MNVPLARGSTAVSLCTYICLSIIILKYVSFRYVSYVNIEAKMSVSLPVRWKMGADRLLRRDWVLITHSKNSVRATHYRIKPLPQK